MAGGAGRPRTDADVSTSGQHGAGGLGPGEEAERFGRTVRTYRMGISATALALAWARQNNAPHGATVVTEREVSPLGRMSRLWTTAPEKTLAFAVVLRPPLSVEESDSAWLVGGLAAAEGAEAVSGTGVATWWPDLVVDPASGEQVGAVKAEIQLGPGQVRSAVVTVRLDLEKLGLDEGRRDELLGAVLRAVDERSASLREGASGVAAAYQGRCDLLGKRVKVRLMPKGETRGTARGVDRMARLELESPSGIVERLPIDTVRELDVV